jgi:hypothetical protein
MANIKQSKHGTKWIKCKRFQLKNVQHLGIKLPFNRHHPKAWKYGAVIKDYNSLGTQNKQWAQRNQLGGGGSHG